MLMSNNVRVRDTGIEPVTSVWKTDVLPLNYARVACILAGKITVCTSALVKRKRPLNKGLFQAETKDLFY